jgi:hypothetical protein
MQTDELRDYRKQVADEIDWQLAMSLECPVCSHDGLVPWTWERSGSRIVEYRCPVCKHKESV